MGRERGAQAPSKTAAAAIATRFTADVLSWDEDAPEARAAVLRQYAGDPTGSGNTTAAAWDGRSRRRVDLVLPPEEVLRLATGELVMSLTARVVTTSALRPSGRIRRSPAAAPTPARSRAMPSHPPRHHLPTRQAGPPRRHTGSPSRPSSTGPTPGT